MKSNGLRAGVAVGALLASVAAAPAWAEEAPATAPVQPEATQPAEGEIVVNGFRKAYEDALRMKREAIQVTDGISADGLGRFPDLNVGEAIQRLPGIQINREADSRNATISLRGLPGTFARTTLNGVGFADPVLNGSTPLGAFNSDIFSAITIVKSPDASNLAGGLSGNIDLQIAPALERKDGGWIKGSYEYDDLGGLGTPKFTAGYNRHITENFAVFGVISYNKETFRRDSIAVNTWNTRLSPAQVGNQAVGPVGANPTYDALTAPYPGGVWYPGQMRQFVKYNKGDLVTGTAGFGWQASDALKFGATGFYTKRNLSQARTDILYVDAGAGNIATSDPKALTGTSAVAHFTKLGTPFVANTTVGPRAYINQFSAENINTFDSVRSEPALQQSWAITPNAEFKNDNWRVALEGTISRAKVYANQIELDIVQNPYYNLGKGLNGITTSVFTGGTDLANADIKLNTPNSTHILDGGYPIAPTANAPTQAGAPMPGQPATVAGNRFGLTGTNGMARTDLDAVQFDVERTIRDSFLSGIAVGLRYEANKFTSTGSRNTALDANGSKITPDMSKPIPYASDFFGGAAPGYTQSWRTLNVDQVLGAVTPVNLNSLPGQFIIAPNSGVFLTPYGLVNNYWDANYVSNNFSNQNDIFSAYGMAKFDHELFGIRVRGNAGLRFEHLATTIVALDCKGCSSAQSVIVGPLKHTMTANTYKNDHNYFLPSFMFAADLTNKLVLRGAYYKTYVRPQPRDNIPISSVTVPETLTPPVDPSYGVSIGATSLKPYTADSFDISVE
jgi:TonB-dependent receptor